MSKRRCLWATSLDWTSTFRVSAHHYARHLAEHGWLVAYLSHPVSPLHLLRPRADAGARWRTWRRGGERDLDGRLYHYVPMTFVPPVHAPILRGRRVLDLWPRVTLPSLCRRLAREGFASVDLLVLDSERYGFLLDRIPARTRVLRMVDYLPGFDATAPDWVERQRALARRVDHVVVTSQVLAREVRELGARAVTYVPNGVDLSRFVPEGHAPPEEFASIDRPRAIYVGALERWFDVGLLRAVAAALPDVSFVLIGPRSAESDALGGLPNVHVLGARAYHDVPRYLAHADVGLIPFRDCALTRTVNPIKLFEYMACGLPVVARRTEELETLNSPARLCRTAQEFARNVADAAHGRIDRRPFLEFARGADWGDRASRLLEAIGCDPSV